jgi:hypothetical protein
MKAAMQFWACFFRLDFGGGAVNRKLGRYAQAFLGIAVGDAAPSSVDKGGIEVAQLCCPLATIGVLVGDPIYPKLCFLKLKQ